MTIGYRILLVGLLAMGCSQARPVMLACPDASAEAAGRPSRCADEPTTAPAAIDDQQRLQRLEKGAEELINRGGVTPAATLIKQLDRRQCALRLASPGKQKMTPSRIYDEHRQGVLIVGGVFKCPRCGHWHANVAGGFLITETGAFVTNHHVAANAKNHTLVAMTHDGRVLAVKEVLSADKEGDVAVLQLDAPGAAFKPLALSTDAPVGSAVTVISHPDRLFYTLTCGVVSRYSERRREGKEVAAMSITADFAQGSSGCPVFNEFGAVAGLVSSTACVYYAMPGGKKGDPQMVVKQCVPALSVLRMVRQ